VGGFRVFYNAMFEICPPSQNPFLYIPSNVMVSFFLYAGMIFTLYSIPPNEGWQCNSISAQKKGAAFFRCQLCIVSVVTLSMRSFYIMFSIYIYGNSLGVFTDDTMFT
jgi:hypothetical protein